MTISNLKPSPKMPVMFVGHGSPMFAITDNPYRKVWAEMGKRFEGTKYPVPQLILCISAHWLTHGWAVTGMAHPKTIHDFGGFPQPLFDVQYPAPGAPEAARDIASGLAKLRYPVAVDPAEWGFDHGTWSVLLNMFPKAHIPVVQLSLNWDAPPAAHFEFAKQLRALRDHGVLIVGSGQLVHNLANMDRRGILGDVDGLVNKTPAYDWAQQFDDFTKACIDASDLAELANFQKLGAVAKMSHPTYEHYLPILYPAACVDEGEPFEYFNDVIDMGSMALRSVVWG